MTDFSIVNAIGGMNGDSQSFNADLFRQQNELSVRMRAITRVHPYMADRPDVVQALAASPLSNTDLINHSGALFGLQVSNNMINVLKGMSPATQRATWASLTPAQQQSIAQQGFTPTAPEDTSVIGALGDAAGAGVHHVLNAVTEVGSLLHVGDVLDGMMWLVDQPAHLYRAIRTMDDGAQLRALAGAVIGAGAVALSPFTGGTSLTALGALGTGALLGGTAAAASTNPSDWYHAWSASADGERTFDRPSQRRAQEILGDPRFLNVARDIAFVLPQNMTILDVAKQVIGQRETDVQHQVAVLDQIASQFAAKGSIQYQQVYGGLARLIQAPQFQEALNVLQNGKISIGRDVADNLGFAPGTRWYSMVSGAVDGVMQFAMDPLLQVGHLGEYRQFLRMGIDVMGGEAAADRFMSIYRAEKRVQRMHEAIAEAVETGNYELMRRTAPTVKERWRDLISYRDQLIETGQLQGKFGVDNFHDWMIGVMDMKPLMEGFGTVRGFGDKWILSSISRKNLLWQSVAGRARAFTSGLTDAATEANLLKIIEEGGDKVASNFFPEVLFPGVIKHEMAADLSALQTEMRQIEERFAQLPTARQQFFEAIANESGTKFSPYEFFDGNYGRAQLEMEQILGGKHTEMLNRKWTAADMTPERMKEFALRNERYQWSRLAGRMAGKIPGGNGLGELLTKMTTMVPAHKAISLVGTEAPEDIRALAELGGLTGMPQWLRREWTDMMLYQPTAGMRMTAVQTYLDNMLTAAGIRTLPEGEELANKFLHRMFQSYAAGGLDSLSIGGLATKQSVYLDEMASAIPMPDLTELRKAIKGGFIAKVIGIADLPVLEQFQAKIWKPSVLLRFGFIPRAAGEEFLNYMLRAGFGSFGAELGARSIARLERYNALMARVKSGAKIIGQADLKLIAEGPMPAGLRRLSAVLAQYDWTSPLDHVLERYSTFYRDMLKNGFGPEESIGKMLSSVAGLDMPLYKLADSVDELNKARAGLSTTQQLRLNLANTMDSIILGNPNSWRRMAVGGVNDDLVEAANEFWGRHGTSVLRAVGASNAAPYEIGKSRQDHIRIYLEDDVNGNPQFADLITMRGQRTLRTNTDPAFAQGYHQEAVRPMQDQLHREVIGPHVSKIKPEHITNETVNDFVQAYHGMNSYLAKDIVDELLLAPDFSRWQAFLHRLDQEAPALAKHLDRTITRNSLSFDNIVASIRDLAEQKKMHVGLDWVVEDLESWRQHANLLDSLPREDRDFIAQYVSHTTPTDASELQRYMDNPMTDMPAPQYVVYRGVSSTQQFQVIMTPDGPMLRVFGQNQPHFGGKGISFTSEPEQVWNYLKPGDGPLAEYHLVIQADGGALERMFGPVGEVPDHMRGGPNGQWPVPGAGADTLPPGPYRIGPYEPGIRGEINVNLGQSRSEYATSFDDAELDRLEQSLRDELAVWFSSYDRQEFDRTWKYIFDDMRSLPIEDRPAAYDRWIQQTREWAQEDAFLQSMALDQDEATQLHQHMRARLQDLVGERQSVGRQELDYIDFKPGEWRLQSVYSENPDLLAKKRETLEERLRYAEEAVQDFAVDPYADTDYWERQIDDYKSQIEDIDARLRMGGNALVDLMPHEESAQSRFFDNIRDGLDQLSDDQIMLLLHGGSVQDVFPVASSDFAHTFTPTQGWSRPRESGDTFYLIPTRGPLDVRYQNVRLPYGQWSGEADLLDVEARNHSEFYKWRTTDQQLGAGAHGWVDVEGPFHDAYGPVNVLVDALAKRWGTDWEGAVEEITRRTVAHYMAMDQSQLNDVFRHAQLSLMPEHFEKNMELLAEAIPRYVRQSLFDTQFGDTFSRGRNVTFDRVSTPWDTIAKLRPQALTGRTWGTMPAVSPFYSSWDEMADKVVPLITSKMNSPEYASRFGHLQGVRHLPYANEDRVFAGLSETTHLHENMVTMWLAETPMSPMTFDEVLRKTSDRQYLLAHRKEVEAWLMPEAGMVPALADQRLADLLNAVGDRPEALAIDFPRRMTENGVEGIGTKLVDPNVPGVWNVENDLASSNAVIRRRDAHLGEQAEDVARRMLQQDRHIWTRGNNQYLVPRTRTLDDGTVQTVVQQEGFNGLVHLPVGERISQREQFYDHNGRAIEWGDEAYFDKVADQGDGQVMWPLVAPILMDGRDEVVGRALFHAKPVAPEIGELVPSKNEIVRAYRSKVRHVGDVGADLPNMVNSPVLGLYKRSKWDEFVRWGFDKVIGPSIDALARRPMAFHFFANRYIQNKALRAWLQDPQLVAEVDRIATNLIKSTAIDPHEIDQVADYARTLGQYSNEADRAGKWSDHHALGWLRGHSEAELQDLLTAARTRVDMELRQGIGSTQDLIAVQQKLGKMAQRDLAEMRMTLPKEMPADDFLSFVRSQVAKESLTSERFFEINKELIQDHPLLSRLREEDWNHIIAAERNWNHIATESADAAAVAAINDMMPFIDSHEFKTQFAEYGKGFLPFWYAEENFMKRWARTLILKGPAVIQKAQLTYMGLKTAGVIRTDPNGKDWFVYPGSNLLQEAANQIPGLPDLPVGVMFQSPTDMMLPGMNTRVGTPQFGPLVSIPLDLLTVPFPELKNMERQIVGDLGASKSALEQVIPAPVQTMFQAITSDDADQRYGSAQLAAIAHLQATGRGLPDNATPGEVDEYLRTVRNHARIIVMSQALGGWFTPGPASQIVVGNEGDATAGLLNGGLEDPGASLNSMYQTLVRNMGIEAGTIEYLNLVPLTDLSELFTGPNADPLAYTTAKNASVSGAPLPATEQALQFFDQNAAYMAEFPNAGPWLLPIDPNAVNAHSQYAYDQQTINGLRRRRSPEEFLTQIKFKEGATRYFQMRTEYRDLVEKARTNKDSNEVQRLNALWDDWSNTYKIAHPIFAAQLEGSASRDRRKAVIKEMRVIADDPNAPKAPHFEVLRQMIHDFDFFITQKQTLALDKSSTGRLEVEKLKKQFESYMNQIVLTNPAVQSFWVSVLRPESELE